MISCGGGGSSNQMSSPPPAPPPPPPAAANDVAITHATVVTMDGATRLEDHTVLVDNGRIVSIEPSTSDTPDATTVVDATGQFLLPGMTDMHVHVYTDNELPLFVANGVTTVRNMWGVPETLQLRQRVNAGTTVGPTIITSGPIIDGSPPFRPGSAVASTAAEGRALVREHRNAGYDFIKVYFRLSREAFEAIADESQRLGIEFAGHKPRSLSYIEVLQSGIWSIEHLDGYLTAIISNKSGLDPDNVDTDQFFAIMRQIRDGARPWSDLFDPATREMLAMNSAANDVAHVPTLVYWQNLYLPRSAEAAEFARDEFRFVHPDIRAEWRIAGSSLAQFTDEQLTLLDLQHDEDFRVVADLLASGNEVLVGTDARNRFVVFGFAIHDELALLVQAGMTPYEAMAAATVNSARFLNQQNQFGRIAVGLRADMVLYAADPTQNIANSRRQRGVVLRGTYYSRARLNELLEMVANSYG